MKKIYRILLVLHIFVGLGAMGGGLVPMINPDKPFGMSADVLVNSPFNDFFIPGIILFTIIGVGNVVSAFVMRYKLRYQGYISSIFSWALVIWIVVQCIMLGLITYIHIFYLVIGLVEATFAMIIVFQKRLFPANIILSFLGKRKMQL